MRTFTFAGSSVRNGKLKVRYANDIMRIKTLEKTGHSAINLVPMPEAMTKLEIVSYMLDIGFAGHDTELQAVVEAEHARLSGKLPKANQQETQTAEADTAEDGPDEDEFEDDFEEEEELSADELYEELTS